MIDREIIADITVANLEEFASRLLTSIYIECLIHGNLTRSEAMETIRLVESKLREPGHKNAVRRLVPLTAQHVMLERGIKLDDGESLIRRTLFSLRCIETL